MPSITYNFDNKSTKWALHTDKKVLDVKLEKILTLTLCYLQQLRIIVSMIGRTMIMFLKSNTSLNIEFPDNTKTSLVKMHNCL